MPAIGQLRCFNHIEREAVARCVECRQYFCRECVAEHDDRIVCASCLQKMLRQPLTKRPAFASALRLCQCAASILLLWFLFYLIGEHLASIPTAFHEETLWHHNWSDTNSDTK